MSHLSDTHPGSDWERAGFEAPDGASLSVLVRQGIGETLVYVPGTYTDAEGALDFLSLLDSKLHIVAVDMRGHGSSWPPPDDFAIEKISDDVVFLADKLGLDRFFVGGHSMGGMMSVDMLRRAPDRLKGAISLEGWTHWQVSPDAFDGKEPPPRAPEIEDAIRRDEERRNAAYLRRWTPEQRKAYGSIWRKFDGYEGLAGTDVAVLEIWGDRGYGPVSRKIMRIPDKKNIELRWIEGSSHKLTFDRPVEVAGLMDEFIRRIAGSGS